MTFHKKNQQKNDSPETIKAVAVISKEESPDVIRAFAKSPKEERLFLEKLGKIPPEYHEQIMIFMDGIIDALRIIEEQGINTQRKKQENDCKVISISDRI